MARGSDEGGREGGDEGGATREVASKDITRGTHQTPVCPALFRCISIRGFVSPSVGPSIAPPVSLKTSPITLASYLKALTAFLKISTPCLRPLAASP